MNMNIGSLANEGVGAVNSIFNRMGYIRAYINSDDTMPVWDGNLMVYNDRTNFTNEHLKFTVSLQVKAHEYTEDKFPDETSYDIEICNLRNYLVDGGVVFFNVLVGPKGSQVYVNYLTKTKIRELLKTAKGDTQRRVKFQKLPRKYSEVVPHLRTLHLQKTHSLIPYDQLQKHKNVQWAIDPYGLTPDANPLEYITTHPVNILAFIEGSTTPLYVGNGAAHISSVSLPETTKVSVAGKTFFNGYTHIVEGPRHTYKIGKSVSIIFQRSRESKIDITISAELAADNLLELLNEIEFILAMFENKTISFNENVLELQGMKVDKATLKEWRAKLKFWKEVEQLFALLDIDEPIDKPLELEEDEINRVQALIAGILYGRTVTGKGGMKEDHLEWVSFSNIRVLVFAQYLSDNRYKLYNIFGKLSAFYKDVDGVNKSASIYSKVIAEDILASNVNWSNLVKSYQEVIKVNHDFYERANWDVLWLIKLYDKHQRITILDAATDLLSWIMETDKKTSWYNVWKYNYLQINARRGIALNLEDKEWLLDQEEEIPTKKDIDDTQKRQTLFAIQVLLSDYSKAKRLYNRLSDDEKQFVSGLPIFTLYKQLESNEQNQS